MGSFNFADILIGAVVTVAFWVALGAWSQRHARRARVWRQDGHYLVRKANQHAARRWQGTGSKQPD